MDPMQVAELLERQAPAPPQAPYVPILPPKNPPQSTNTGTEQPKNASNEGSEVRQGTPARAWKPSGAKRDGQRSGSRRLPPAVGPVDPEGVLATLKRRWRASRQSPSWSRTRALAALAIVLAMPAGSTV